MGPHPVFQGIVSAIGSFVGDVLENIVRKENKVSVTEDMCRQKFVTYLLNHFSMLMNCDINGPNRYVAV